MDMLEDVRGPTTGHLVRLGEGPGTQGRGGGAGITGHRDTGRWGNGLPTAGSARGACTAGLKDTSSVSNKVLIRLCVLAQPNSRNKSGKEGRSSAFSNVAQKPRYRQRRKGNG